MNSLTAADLKRRGFAALEAGLRRGPVHITRHNKPAAVVLSEADYAALSGSQPAAASSMTALQWLLNQPARGTRRKAQLDRRLREEREGWA